jgi:hypothetical protein
VKLIRGYRFKREAIRMLKTFLVVWIGGFGLLAGCEWLWGKDTWAAVAALSLTALLLPLIAGFLFLIWAGIRMVEKRSLQPNERVGN